MNDAVRTARLAGACWLIVILGGVAAFLAQSSAPRVAFAINQFSGLVYLGVTVLLYQLFKPVNRDLSLFAFCCGLAGVASGSALALDPSPGLTQGFYVAMSFFGFQVMTVGLLIMRSKLIPRFIGALLFLGGLSYDIAAFASFVGVHLPPFVVPVAILGEGTLTVWLLVKGVKTV